MSNHQYYNLRLNRFVLFQNVDRTWEGTGLAERAQALFWGSVLVGVLFPGVERLNYQWAMINNQ